MTIKKGYNTRHKEELLEYLSSMPGRHMTAGEICTCLKSKGSTIGTATVYRQLEKLVDDGRLNKYIIDEGTSACYEFVPEEDHLCEKNCYHCKCESCGVLIHMDCSEIMSFVEHIKEHHGFEIDPYRTVLYGKCSGCMAKEG